MTPETILHYRIINKLGAGGVGQVYLAEDPRLGRQVALKLLTKDLAANEDAKRRFFQEAKAASALNHPHIITIYDVGSEQGRDFIVMEYVEGESVRQRLQTDGELAPKQVAEIGAQITSALARAHKAGIIHRDLKPENIMLRPDGYAKILDFGLAKLSETETTEVDSEAETAQLNRTSPGIILGTIRYMSPEQARGEPVDQRSDIFSLGCVLYEMATGRSPFMGKSAVETLHAIVYESPSPIHQINATIPAELQRIIFKCLQKEPADRYQHADDIEVDLRQVQFSIESGRYRLSQVTERSDQTAQQVASGDAVGWAPVPGKYPSVLQNLIRRRFLQTLGGYLIGVALLIQLVKWGVNRFMLSNHLVDLCLWTLLPLLPAVALLAYFRSTPNRKKWTKMEKIGVPMNLLAVALLLFISFSGKDLGAATTSIWVKNEQGQIVERVIPKGEFRKKMFIFFFENESGDPTWDWLQYGISNMLEYDLSQDIFLQVKTGHPSGMEMSHSSVYETMRQKGHPDGVGLPLALKGNIADDLHMPYFVSGSFVKQDDRVRLEVSLYETRNLSSIAVDTFEGENIFDVIDKASVQLKRDLEIPDAHIEEVKDLPLSEIMTSSIPALRLYTMGINDIVFRQDWQTLQQHLEQSVEQDPTFALAQWKLAAVHLFTNQNDKAAQDFQLLFRHLYKLPERYQFITKAEYYHFKQDPDKQFAVVNMWGELYPEDVQAHAQLAWLHEHRNQFDQAIAEFKRILELDPEQYDVLQHIGALYQRQDELEKALKYYNQYAAQFPNQPKSFTALGKLYTTVGDYQKAKSYYEKAAVLEPGNVPVLLSLADIESHFGHFTQALGQYRDALDISQTPQDRAAAYHGLESYYERRGQICASIEYAQLEIAELEKFAPPLILLIEKMNSLAKHVRAGQKKLAFHTIEAIEAEMAPPFDQYIAFGYLDIYLELEDIRAAENAANDADAAIKAFRSDINRPIIFLARGRIHEMKGQYEQAIASYRQQLELTPTDATIMRRIGRCYRKLKKFRRAEKPLQRALKIHPFGAKENHEMALLYADRGNREKALEHLKIALDVWKDAEPIYQPAKKAREKLAQLEAAS